MTTMISLMALAVLAGAPQEAPASAERPAVDITRDLNAGPPGWTPPARPPEPVPAPVSAPTPAPAQATPTVAESAPSLTESLNRAPPGAAPARPQPSPAPVAVAPQPRPQPLPAAEPPAVVSAPAPAEAPVAPRRAEPAPPPAAMAPASVAPASVDPAALPFRVDLPDGFRVTQGRPGSNFSIYAVRRDETPFVMVYAGPASQFPIYDGEQVSRGGRDTLIVTEDGRRLALEHLFRTEGEPAEIHVWVASLDGADRDLAERIAQTVDPR